MHSMRETHTWIALFLSVHSVWKVIEGKEQLIKRIFTLFLTVLGALLSGCASVVFNSTDHGMYPLRESDSQCEVVIVFVNDPSSFDYGTFSVGETETIIRQKSWVSFFINSGAVYRAIYEYPSHSNKYYPLDVHCQNGDKHAFQFAKKYDLRNGEDLGKVVVLGYQGRSYDRKRAFWPITMWEARKHQKKRQWEVDIVEQKP